MVEQPGESTEMETADAAQVLTVSRQTGIMSSRLKKKLLDREVPYNEIPVNDRTLYHEAEKAEWASRGQDRMCASGEEKGSYATLKTVAQESLYSNAFRLSRQERFTTDTTTPITSQSKIQIVCSG